MKSQSDEYLDIEDRLLFIKGVFCLLKATDLFGPMIEKGLNDIDSILERIGNKYN